jgi:hypothetical protein
LERKRGNESKINPRNIPMEKWALLVGINDYKHLNNLKYPVNDVLEVKKTFSDLLEFPEDHITLLSDDSENKPGIANICYELGNIGGRKKVKNEDLLVFYFAGHGMNYKNDGKDYLLTSDTSREALKHTEIKVGDVIDYLKKTECKNIVMFIDACREMVGDARALEDDPIGQDSEEVIRSRKGIVSFFACDPKFKSYEIDELEHGSFTYNVLEAIKSPNCSTVEDIAEFLRENVESTNDKYGKPPQRPYTVADPIDKLKQAFFANRTQLEEMGKEFDDLLQKLGDRYYDGLLEPDLFNQTVDVVNKARKDIANALHKRMCDEVKKYCQGDFNDAALRVSLNTIERRNP